jgi:hypothetical protein
MKTAVKSDNKQKKEHTGTSKNQVMTNVRK